jgi:tetratricopeptide (TPR) repeat protein
LAVRLAGSLLCLAALVGSPGCGGDVESQLAEVRSLQDAGQYDPSIAPLRKLLAESSNHPEANYRLGIALVQTGRPSLAVWPLQKASETDEYGIQAGMLLSSTLYSNGSFEESIRAASNVLGRDPSNLAALYTRANARLSSGQPEKTLEDADKILEIRPDDTIAISLRGAALIDLDRGDEAEQTFKELASESEGSGDANDAARKCAALASFYRSQNDIDRARETFEGCIAKFPEHNMLQQWVSDFFVETGEPDKAIAVWRQAVERTPEDLALRAKLADLLYGQGQEAEALEVVKESVELFDTPQAWRMLSSYHRKTGNPAEARQALEEAMERTRQVSPALRFALADLLIEEGNIERAKELAATLQEPSYRQLLNGAILLKQGDAEAALAEFEKGLRLWPNNAGARFMAGLAALELGQRERAISEFREAVRVDETETDAALYLAEIHFSLGQHKAALQFADRHIKKRPYVEPSAHVIAARSAMALGQADRAEGYLQNLKAKDPKTPTPYVEFAAIKRKQEGPEAAIEVILKSGVDVEDPANIEALRPLVSDYVSLGKTDEALAQIRSALRAHPDSLVLIDLEARVLARADKRDEARQAAERALAAEAEYAPSLEILGSLARAEGDLDGALAYFERASKADPANGEYAYLVAQTLLMKGETDKSMAQLRKTLQVEPGHIGANNDLAWLLASTGKDLDDALELALRAVRRGRSAETLDTLGYVHLQKGNAEEAVDALDKALEANPNSPSIEYRLGKALIANGDKDRAKAVLTKALETPSFPEAEAARLELAKLQES